MERSVTVLPRRNRILSADTITRTVIQNGGNTCYFDTVLMCIFGLSNCCDESLDRKHPVPAVDALRLALKSLFVDPVRMGIRVSGEHLNQLRERMRDCGWEGWLRDRYPDGRFPPVQQDASEFLHFFLSVLDCNTAFVRRKTMHGGLPSSTDCGELESVPFLALSFPETTHTPEGEESFFSLEGLLDSWFFDNTVTEGVYRYVVDNSPSTPSGPPQSGSIIQCLAAHERAIPALNTYTLAGFPFSLPIVLKRFRNDGSKINNSVSFPTELFLDKYFGSSDAPEWLKDIPWRLKGFVCHRGEESCSGHYVAYLPAQRGNYRQWFFFDDEASRSVVEIEDIESEMTPYRENYIFFYEMDQTLYLEYMEKVLTPSDGTICEDVLAKKLQEGGDGGDSSSLVAPSAPPMEQCTSDSEEDVADFQDICNSPPSEATAPVQTQVRVISGANSTTLGTNEEGSKVAESEGESGGLSWSRLERASCVLPINVIIQGHPKSCLFEVFQPSQGTALVVHKLPSRLMTSPFSGPMICVTLKDHLQRSFQAWLRRCQALSSSHSSLPSEGSSDSSSSLSNSVADLHLRPLCSSSSKPIHPLPKFLTGNHAFQVSVARLSKEATAEEFQRGGRVWTNVGVLSLQRPTLLATLPALFSQPTPLDCVTLLRIAPEQAEMDSSFDHFVRSHIQETASCSPEVAGAVSSSSSPLCGVQ